MTTDFQSEQGKKLFGIGVLLFGHGLIWFVGHRYPIFCRPEMVVGAALAAYGILEWRSASRRLSLVNYIIVLSCAAVLLLCVFKMSEWVKFLNQQRGFSILNDLALSIIEITMVVCIVVFGGWWADSAFMQGRLRRYMGSNRFVK
jgi:hypothetical protein